MANIRFGDYLKSKKKQKAVYESDEALAKRVVSLLRTDSCAVQPRFRALNMEKALELLEQIPDHPDADELERECREELDKALILMVQMDYENAKFHLETAETEYEYQKSAQELAEVAKELEEVLEPSERPEGLAEDVLRLKEQADAKAGSFSSSVTRHRWGLLILLAALIAAVIYAFVSGFVWYAAAKLEGMGGLYESAYTRFYKLGDYLDSREQYEYYKGKYLDSRVKEEGHKLSDAKAGNKVEFSGLEWQVLEKDGTKLTMICRAIDEDSAFAHVAYDKTAGKETEAESTESESTASGSTKDSALGSASWAESSLRAYLNEQALESEFSPEEIAAFEVQTTGPSENERYGTKLDESTEDLISILSVEMAQKYIEEGVLKNPSNDMWLRTPGNDMQSAAYMTSDGQLILYGNDVTDDSLSVCPVIIVDYTKLES